MNSAKLEKEEIVIWSVTVQDIYLVRLGDFKIKHKAFSQDLVYLTFTLVFYSCHYRRFTRIKPSVAPAISGGAGRDRLQETFLLSDLQVAHSRPPTQEHREMD